MAIVAGAADAIVPVGSSARFYAAYIPHAEVTIFPGDVGHYVFLADCTEAGRATLPALVSTRPVSTATRCTRRRRTSPKPTLHGICASTPSPSRRHRIDGETRTYAARFKGPLWVTADIRTRFCEE